MHVLIVDDHPVLQEVLPAMVKKAMGDCEVHVTGNLSEALARISAAEVDLVLLDLGLPGCMGIEALMRVRGQDPKVRIAVVSSADDGAIIRAALKAGAVAYIPKTSKPDVIMAALQVVQAGGTYVPREAIDTDGAPLSGANTLSPRQQDVLELMQKGLSNREIASELNIVESTVKQHLGVIYGFLGVTTRAEAIVAAARMGLARK